MSGDEHRPHVSIVVPNWNGESLIGDCLASLKAQEFSDFEVVVVDNGSRDGSVSLIARDYPDVKVVVLDKNLGFSVAVNEGVSTSRGEFVLLLNNDAVADPECLGHLVTMLDRDPGLGAVACRMIKQNGKSHGKIDSAGNSYSSWGIPFPRGRDEDPAKFDDSTQVFALSGGACLIRREALDRVGPFDPKFFMYYEDVDWSFRARLAGYGIRYQPLAVVRHLVGASSGGGYSPLVRFHAVKNSWVLYLKNMPTPLLWRYLPKFLLSQALMLASSIRHGLLLPHLKGLGWVIASFSWLVVSRRNVQRNRRLGTSDVSLMITQQLPPQYRDRFIKSD